MTGTVAIPQLTRGEKAAVAGDDPRLGVHQDRVRPAELQARGDLRRLLRAVRSRVLLVRPVIDGPVDELAGSLTGDPGAGLASTWPVVATGAASLRLERLEWAATCFIRLPRHESRGRRTRRAQR